MTENSNAALSIDDWADKLTQSEDQAEADEHELEEDDEPTDADDEIEDAEEVDEDDDPEADDEDDEDDEAEDPEELIDVQGQKVTLDELKRGFLREADYTRKTQELAEQRRSVEREVAAARQAQKQLQDQLAQWATAADREPDWSKLAQEMDPREFNQTRVRWEAHQRRKQEAADLWRQIQAEQHQQTVAQQTQTLLESVPEWKNPEVAKREAMDLIGFAAEYGFAQQEIAAVTDARIVRLLRDAASAKKQRQADPRKKRVTKAQKTLPPGTKTTKSQTRSTRKQKLRERARSTNNIDDWARLLSDE